MTDSIQVMRSVDGWKNRNEICSCRFDFSEGIGRELGLSIATLADWRSQRRGPTYLSVGRKIWYPKDRVDMWLEANLRETSNDDFTKAEREMALSL